MQPEEPPSGTLARLSAIEKWLLARTAIATGMLSLAFGVYIPVTTAGAPTTRLLLLGTVALALVTSFAVGAYYQRTRDTVTAGRALLASDVLLVTAAIGTTGGAGSVLAVLYGASVVAATTTLGPRAAAATGTLALFSYVIVGGGMALGIVPHPPDQPALQYLLHTTDLVFALSSNALAIGLVTALAYVLAAQGELARGQLRRSEMLRLDLVELHESILRSVGSGLVTARGDGTVTTANRAARELLLVPEAAPLTARLTDFFPTLDPSGPGVERAETRAVRTDGREFPAGFSRTALRDASGLEVGTLVAFQDLTEVRALERTAREAERLAMLGRVAATLAHEVRNPLGSISGSVELVRESSALSPEDDRLLALVLGEVERLGVLVETMLDVSKPRSSKPRAFDLDQLAADVVTMAKASPLARGVSIELTARSPADGVADPAMTQQILWNLVRNAVQSVGQGGHVEVRVGHTNGALFVEVRDDGPGVPLAERERIFDPFHSGRTRGVGLGLTLVKQLVDAQGGHIEVSDADPKGSVFRVELPQPATRPAQA